ncbi:MAG: hypothetical protein LQ351_005467 [Letrouitia transgressa]|nr:MAG: hypothetical protein LQ351_005467 [Letrouitia transgressa]
MQEVENHQPSFSDGKTSAAVDSKANDGDFSLNSSDQVGVEKIEAISQAWTKWSLIAAYIGAFSLHSLVSTVLVVQQVVNGRLSCAKIVETLLIEIAVIKPPMAKIANVFGRLEAFCISVFLYIIGYIQMAGSNNVKTFASAQIFYSAGSQGLQILTQIFIADTSNLLNRALWSSLPDIPFLVTVWVGPEIASDLLSHTTWRWGYGIWTIVLPISFLPLAISLILNTRKAAKLVQLPAAPWKGATFLSGVKNLWYELDVGGLLLLSAAFSLILIPCTLAARAKGGWNNGSMIAMVVVGYFSPDNNSITAAGHITQVFSFTSTVSSVAIGLIIKYTHHYKYYITVGAAIYLLGIGIMIRYRVQGSSTAQIVGTQIAVGIGGGIVNVPAQLGVQASVNHDEVAAATAVFLTIVEIGGAVGSAISGAVWTKNIPKKLALYLPENAKGDALDIFGNITLAQSYPVGGPERVAIDRSYQETMNILLIIAVCLVVPLLPLSLILKNYNLNQVRSATTVSRVKGVTS